MHECGVQLYLFRKWIAYNVFKTMQLRHNHVFAIYLGYHERHLRLLLQQFVNHLIRGDVGKRSITSVYRPEMPLRVRAEEKRNKEK
jgi:hypothetical protein